MARGNAWQGDGASVQLCGSRGVRAPDASAGKLELLVLFKGTHLPYKWFGVFLVTCSRQYSEKALHFESLHNLADILKTGSPVANHMSVL